MREQPPDPKEFLTGYLLFRSQPKYTSSYFFNALRNSDLPVTRLTCASRRTPPFENLSGPEHPSTGADLVWAARIQRCLLRWVKRRHPHIRWTAAEQAKIDPMLPGALRKNWTRMDLAVTDGRLDEIAKLLGRGFEINAKPFGTSAIWLAAARNQLRVCQFLFVRGGELHSQGHDGSLPIEVAAYLGYVDIVEFFHRNGCCVGRSVELSAAAGRHEVVNYLCKHRDVFKAAVGAINNHQTVPWVHKCSYLVRINHYTT